MALNRAVCVFVFLLAHKLTLVKIAIRSIINISSKESPELNETEMERGNDGNKLGTHIISKTEPRPYCEWSPLSFVPTYFHTHGGGHAFSEAPAFYDTFYTLTSLSDAPPG